MKTHQQNPPRFKRWSRKSYAAFASIGRHVTIGVLPVTMSIVLLATKTSSAQTPDSLSQEKILHIDEVMVTGYKSSPVRSVMTQTTLFDRDVAAARPLQSVESALRLVPSIDIRERGGKAVQTDISVRGGSFDQTQVMLNGINFTDARTGHQSHSLPIDIESIRSVELIEDVAGVGAYAGAVNITTAPLHPRYLRFEGTGGSYGSAYGSLSGAVTSAGFRLMGAASYRRSDGYRYNTDFDNTNAYLRATYDSDKAGIFDFQAGYQLRSFGSNGFYAGYNPDQWERTSTALASMRWSKGVGAWTLAGSVSYRKNFDRYDWTRGQAMNRHNTDNIGADLTAHLQWDGGTTSLGGDYVYNHIFSTNLGEKLSSPRGDYTCADSRHVGNIWLRHTKHWNRVSVSASAGAAFSPYGTSALWNASLSYRPARGFDIEAGASQSMRLPTFTDLYYSSPAQVNNLDLVPEHAITYRLRAAYARGAWSVAASAFYRDGRDIIDWVWHADGEYAGKWHSEQTNSLSTLGAEITGGYTSDKGVLRQATISYGWTDSSQDGTLVTRNAMDFMRHKASAAVTVAFLRDFTLSVAGSVFDRNGSYTFYPVAGDSSQTEIRDYKPYALLDARLSWQRGIWQVYLDATNITSTDYCDMGGLPLPGRWFTAGLVVTIR